MECVARSRDIQIVHILYIAQMDTIQAEVVAND